MRELAEFGKNLLVARRRRLREALDNGDTLPSVDFSGLNVVEISVGF